MLKNSSFSSFFDINFNGDKMNFKNWVIIISSYLLLLGIFVNLLINQTVSLLTTISAYIFSSIFLLFIYIYLINYIEIRYKIDLLNKNSNSKVTSKRKFNACIAQLKKRKINYNFLYLKLNNLDKNMQKILNKKIINYLNIQDCKAIYTKNDDKIFIITTSTKSVIKSLDKIIYILSQKINLLKNITIYNNLSEFLS